MCAPVERENGALLHGDLLLAPLQDAQPLFVVLPVVVTTGYVLCHFQGPKDPVFNLP